MDIDSSEDRRQVDRSHNIIIINVYNVRLNFETFEDCEDKFIIFKLFVKKSGLNRYLNPHREET